MPKKSTVVQEAQGSTDPDAKRWIPSSAGREPYRYLWDQFLPKYWNQRNTVSLDLAQVFCLKDTRKLSGDSTPRETTRAQFHRRGL